MRAPTGERVEDLGGCRHYTLGPAQRQTTGHQFAKIESQLHDVVWSISPCFRSWRQSIFFRWAPANPGEAVDKRCSRDGESLKSYVFDWIPDAWHSNMRYEIQYGVPASQIIHYYQPPDCSFMQTDRTGQGFLLISIEFVLAASFM